METCNGNAGNQKNYLSGDNLGSFCMEHGWIKIKIHTINILYSSNQFAILVSLHTLCPAADNVGWWKFLKVVFIENYLLQNSSEENKDRDEIPEI